MFGKNSNSNTALNVEGRGATGKRAGNHPPHPRTCPPPPHLPAAPASQPPPGSVKPPTPPSTIGVPGGGFTPETDEYAARVAISYISTTTLAQRNVDEDEPLRDVLQAAVSSAANKKNLQHAVKKAYPGDDGEAALKRVYSALSPYMSGLNFYVSAGKKSELVPVENIHLSRNVAKYRILDNVVHTVHVPCRACGTDHMLVLSYDEYRQMETLRLQGQVGQVRDLYVSTFSEDTIQYLRNGPKCVPSCG